MYKKINQNESPTNYQSIYVFKMVINEVKDMVSLLEIGEEESQSFKAAVIILYGLSNNTVSKQKIKRATGYWQSDVDTIIENLWSNDIIYEYYWNMDLNEKDFFMELILCSLAGTGDIIRKSKTEWESKN